MTNDYSPAARRADMVESGLWMDETLLDHFGRNVTAHPDKTALIAVREEAGDETRLSFAELDSLADQVAVGLSRCDIKEGDIVSFQLPNWWQFTVLHLACLKIGAVSNPLMVIFRERELRFMLGLAESKILIIPAMFRGTSYPAITDAVRADLPCLAHVFVIDGGGNDDFEQLIAKDASAAELAALRAFKLSPDAVIQLLYTSGTTGEAKGVTHTSNTMLSNLVPFAKRLRMNGDDILHMPSPLAHQLGFMYGLVLPAMVGATAILQDVFVPAEMARQISEEGATWTMGATPFLSDLTDYCIANDIETPSLKVFVSAGAPIPRVLVSKARDTLKAVIISAWGMSENGVVTSALLDDAEDKITGTDGYPLPGMAVRVVGEDGQTLGADEEGDLYVKGCSNFVGYLKRPELAKITEDGWFDTGDIARIDSDGYIRIAGRSKDIIIRGGENIPVVEIENMIFKLPAVATVAIVAYPDDRLGERACAYVTLQDGAQLTLDDIITYLLSQDTTKQYLPERLEIVGEMPTTPSGKIQKFKLRDMLREKMERAKGIEPMH